MSMWYWAVIATWAGVGLVELTFVCYQMFRYRLQNNRSRILQIRALEELFNDGYVTKVGDVYKTRAGNEIEPL